jgi:hypothetical protein
MIILWTKSMASKIQKVLMPEICPTLRWVQMERDI